MQWQLSNFAGGKQDGTTTPEVSIAYLRKLNIGSIDPTFRGLSKKNENVCPHEDLHQMFRAALTTIAQTWNNPNVDQHVNG